MNRWTLAAATALSAAVVSLTACSSTPPTTERSAVASLNRNLQAFHWSLQSAQDQGGHPLPAFTALAPQTVVRLQFTGEKPDEQRITTRVCNNIGGAYQLSGNTIHIGSLIATRMACADSRLMQLEQAVLAQLDRAQTVHLVQDANAPRMELQFSDGSLWRLLGQPTAATRYGSTGETIFWEVGPQRKPCLHGAMGQTQCLQVRPVHYDNAGRKTTASDWAHFYGTIEGYQHEAGTRNVLRLKRYTLQNPPADASRYAYVLDMTVESERVQ